MSQRKKEKIDGLSPEIIKKVRSAIRIIWQRSHARKLVVKRCTRKDGFTYCEKCKECTPKLKVDHIERVGDVDGGFIQRLFVSSFFLQGLCPPCHNDKTKMERKRAKAKTQVKKDTPNFTDTF